MADDNNDNNNNGNTQKDTNKVKVRRFLGRRAEKQQEQGGEKVEGGESALVPSEYFIL